MPGGCPGLPSWTCRSPAPAVPGGLARPGPGRQCLQEDRQGPAEPLPHHLRAQRARPPGGVERHDPVSGLPLSCPGCSAGCAWPDPRGRGHCSLGHRADGVQARLGPGTQALVGLASLLGVSGSGNITHSWDTEAQIRGGAGAPPPSPAFPGILLVQLGLCGGGGAGIQDTCCWTMKPLGLPTPTFRADLTVGRLQAVGVRMWGATPRLGATASAPPPRPATTGSTSARLSAALPAQAWSSRLDRGR